MSWSSPSPPKRRHRLRALVIVLVVLAALLVAADRIGLHVAQSVAATQIQKSPHLGSKPSVDVAGFPFLTQLAESEYGEITVTAHDVELDQNGRQARLDTLTTVLHHVDTSRDFHHVHAQSLTATGTTTLDQVGAATGLQLSAAGSGRVAATTTIASISVTVSAEPVIQNGQLTFKDPRLEKAGSLAGSVSEAIGSLFQITVPLDGIPFHLRATSVTVSGSTVRFALSGSDVTLTNS